MKENNRNRKPMVELSSDLHSNAIEEYKAEKYVTYVIAKNKYNMYHKLSDLLDMIDSGIACDIFTQYELESIIAKQDAITQKIMLAQYGKYIKVK